MNRPPLRGLYAITREHPDGRESLLVEVEAALRGGVALLQYRNKTATARRRMDEAESLLLLCNQYGVPLIINDDVTLASCIGADGVHLGQEDMDPIQAREKMGPSAIIGVSCYNDRERARHALASGADYLAFGSFFPSPTKPQAVRATPELLQQWRGQGSTVCAIGGITLDNAAGLIEAGADLLAVISSLWHSADIEQTARNFTALYQN